MRCGLARCPGAKSTRFSIMPVVSFSHVQAISSRLQCNTADWPSGRWVPTLPSQYLGYQRKQSTWPWTSNDSCVPFSVLEMMLTSTALINLMFFWPCIMNWLYINYQLWCTDYYLFIKYYSPLHLSSLKCSSSGGYSCIHAAYGTVTVPGGMSVHSSHPSCVPTGHQELSYRVTVTN